VLRSLSLLPRGRQTGLYSVVSVIALGEATGERAKLAIGVAGEVGECARARDNGPGKRRQGRTWGKFNLVAPELEEGNSKPLN
jgi:hypothetical protein